MNYSRNISTNGWNMTYRFFLLSALAFVFVTATLIAQTESASNVSVDNTTQQQVQSQIDAANDEFTDRTIFWIALFAATSIIYLILLFVVRAQLLGRVSGLEGELNSLRKVIETDAIGKETKKLGMSMEQLQQFNEKQGEIESFEELENFGHIDHTLPLRVADELHRMRKRIDFMDDKTQGLKALKNSLKRLEDELNTGGYELVDLIGQKYVDGLNVEARFVPAEKEGQDEELITDIMRPQVNYLGIMIQQAKVEVSKSY